MMRATKENPISRPIANFWTDNEGIVHIHFKPVYNHGIEQARTVVDVHNQLAAGGQVCILADLQSTSSGANREARTYYTTDEASKYKKGMAMVVRTPIQKLLGTIFVGLSRPPYPTKLFTSTEDALGWLHEIAPG